MSEPYADIYCTYCYSGWHEASSCPDKRRHDLLVMNRRIHERQVLSRRVTRKPVGRVILRHSPDMLPSWYLKVLLWKPITKKWAGENWGRFL